MSKSTCLLALNCFILLCWMLNMFVQVAISHQLTDRQKQLNELGQLMLQIRIHQMQTAQPEGEPTLLPVPSR